MEAKAIAKGLRVSPIKARLVVDMIRGKNANEALTILNNVKNKSAKLVKKVLESAIANAVNNEGADEDKLYIKKIYVDEGPTLKRFRARAKGSGTQILKRTCHISCVVEER